MRVKIVLSLKDFPQNAHQLAQNLGVNYRTVMHHLSILEENGIVKSEGPKYGKVYFLTDLFTKNFELFEKIIKKGRRT